MCKKTKALAKNILNFAKDPVIINYINELYQYGELLKVIAARQSLESTNVEYDEDLKKGYNFHRRKIKATYIALNKSLEKNNLSKEDFLIFNNQNNRIKKRFAEAMDLIEITKLFCALIRNHKSDTLEMSLGDRISYLENLKKDFNSAQSTMHVAELVSLKNYIKVLEEKALLKIN